MDKVLGLEPVLNLGGSGPGGLSPDPTGLCVRVYPTGLCFCSSFCLRRPYPLVQFYLFLPVGMTV